VDVGPSDGERTEVRLRLEKTHTRGEGNFGNESRDLCYGEYMCFIGAMGFSIASLCLE
jgi:hypothetical protein